MKPDVGSLANYFLAQQAISRDAADVLEELRAAVARANPFYGDNAGDDAFENVSRVHDWRNHVPEGVRAIWPRLSEEARLAVLLVAEVAASNEEWD